MFFYYRRKKYYSNISNSPKKKYWDYKKNTRLTKKQKIKRVEARKFFFNLRKKKKITVKSKINRVSKNITPYEKKKGRYKKKKYNKSIKS